jgi:hypothetical protein
VHCLGASFDTVVLFFRRVWAAEQPKNLTAPYPGRGLPIPWYILYTRKYTFIPRIPRIFLLNIPLGTSLVMNDKASALSLVGHRPSARRSKLWANTKGERKGQHAKHEPKIKHFPNLIAD